MTTKHEISFILQANLKSMFFNPAKPEGISITIEQPRHISLEMKPVDTNDDPFGHMRGLICKVRTKLQVTAEERQFVSSLIKGQYIPFEDMPLSLPLHAYGDEQIDKDGAIRKGLSIPFEIYPPETAGNLQDRIR